MSQYKYDEGRLSPGARRGLGLAAEGETLPPHDFGWSDDELMNMSVQDRNRVLAELNREQAGEPRDPRLADTCPVTHGDHDWSEESYSTDPAARTFTVCIACGVNKLAWLHG